MSIKDFAALVLVTAVIVIPQTAAAKDSCETVLCMWGKLNGEVDPQCEPPIQDYFDIIKRKHGKIKWSTTSDARQKYLNDCGAADRTKTKAINDVYGRSRG